MCEGVQIRAKMNDLIKCEKVSAYLLGKEKNGKSLKLFSKVRRHDGSVIDNTDGVMTYIKDYFDFNRRSIVCYQCFLDGLDSFLQLGERAKRHRRNSSPYH